MKLKLSFLMIALGLSLGTLRAQDLPLIRVSENQRYLVTEDGQPFFWLGGTAWELIHRLNREEIDTYLENRAAKGFTVIQTVILAELDGLNTPNAYGQRPLIGNDPTRPNESYFELVDYVVKKAGELGMYVGLLPTWGDKFNKKWGVGPEIFNEKNAFDYGEFLGKRYAGSGNIIWILGGDRALETAEHRAIIENMAMGIQEEDPNHLLSFHPVGAKKARDFVERDWLDVDMYQSGHSRDAKVYGFARESRALEPVKPVVNGEPLYENIRGRFWENPPGPWLDDADVRVSAYRTMLAGAAGYTYGCNDIWQMYAAGRDPVLDARTGWEAALDLPGSGQVGLMKDFFETFPWQSMVERPDLILNDNPEGSAYMMAAEVTDGGLILAYTPLGETLNIDLSGVDTGRVKASWFNPRSGDLVPIGTFPTGDHREFTPWASGRGSDFLLVLEPIHE